MKRIFYLSIVTLIFGHCYGQTLDGLWKGHSERSILILNPTEIILEIKVSNDTMISGVIHNYYSKGRFEHVKISGIIDWKDSVLNILEEGEISHNINTKIYQTCLGRMKLDLTKTGDRLYLKGNWKDKSRKIFHCPTLQTSFEKTFEADNVKTHQTEINLYRTDDIQKVIELESDETDSIKCSLYDNGEIDNDTASVYYNDRLIMKNVRLSETPVDFYISVDKKNPLPKITLIAENLGSIPPNTALLVINTRKNRYQITLSSSFSKNASIEFFLKEK